MSEENEVVQEEPIDYKAMYEQQKEELEKVLHNKNELLAEKKKTQKERDEAKIAAQRAQEEQAKKDGEFEKLWQTEAEQRKTLENKLAEITNNIRQEKINMKALQLSNELANKAENAELLSHFVQQKLSGLADENGIISQDLFESVKKEFSNDKKFAALVAGNQSNGGGAPGGVNSVKATGVSRADFMKWDSAKQMQYIKSGNTLTD